MVITVSFIVQRVIYPRFFFLALLLCVIKPSNTCFFHKCMLLIVSKGVGIATTAGKVNEPGSEANPTILNILFLA